MFEGVYNHCTCKATIPIAVNRLCSTNAAAAPGKQSRGLHFISVLQILLSHVQLSRENEPREPQFVKRGPGLAKAFE